MDDGRMTDDNRAIDAYRIAVAGQ